MPYSRNPSENLIAVGSVVSRSLTSCSGKLKRGLRSVLSERYDASTGAVAPTSFPSA